MYIRMTTTLQAHQHMVPFSFLPIRNNLEQLSDDSLDVEMIMSFALMTDNSSKKTIF